MIVLQPVACWVLSYKRFLRSHIAYWTVVTYCLVELYVCFTKLSWTVACPVSRSVSLSVICAEWRRHWSVSETYIARLSFQNRLLPRLGHFLAVTRSSLHPVGSVPHHWGPQFSVESFHGRKIDQIPFTSKLSCQLFGYWRPALH